MEPEPQEVNGTFNLEFEIGDDSSKRGRPKLVDNRGYSYNIQRRRGENTDWQCTVRPKVYNYILFIMLTQITCSFFFSIDSFIMVTFENVSVGT